MKDTGVSDDADSGQISIMARTDSQREGGRLRRMFRFDDGEGA